MEDGWDMNYSRLLEGKKAFITTGAQGIGKAIAMLFAQHGAVIVLGGRNKTKLDTTMADLHKISPNSKGYLFDCGDKAEIEQVCDQIIETFDGVDILVNTVGVNIRSDVHLYNEDTIDKLIDINLKSGIRCMKKLVPGMLERGFGNIINISSIHAVQSMPGFGAYAATKGAMNALGRVAALDYARRGIRVNTICPGLIMSDNMMQEVESYPEGPERDDFLRLLDSMQPLEPGKSEDIANAALYFASDMSSYVTGQVLMVDGGASIKAH